MLNLERFLEVPVIGVMLLSPLVPILADGVGWLRLYRVLGRSTPKRERLVIALGVVFVAGVVGGRLVDDTFHAIRVDSRECYRHEYNEARRNKGGAAVSLDAAELKMANEGEYSRFYVERHHIFMRVDRAGAIAAILWVIVLLSMAVHRRRVTIRSTVGILLLLMTSVAFVKAFRSEAHSHWMRVSEDSGVPLATRCEESLREPEY